MSNEVRAQHPRTTAEFDRIKALAEAGEITTEDAVVALVELAKLLERDLAAVEPYALELREALEDCANGLRYIRGTHGELYGVGFDRALGKADAALAKNPSAVPVQTRAASDAPNAPAATNSEGAVTGHIPPMPLPAMKAAAIEIIQKLDRLARDVDSYEYGLPMFDDNVQATLTLAVIEILHQHSSCSSQGEKR